MTTKTSLNTRRRLQTVLEVQDATINLAERHGYEHVTTEMIAHEVGISPRTFFNYFRNKEEALLGGVSGYPTEAMDAFAAHQGKLTEGVRTLLLDIFSAQNAERLRTRRMIAILRGSAHLAEKKLAMHADGQDQIIRALMLRHPQSGAVVAGILAGVISSAIAQFAFIWSEDEAITLDDVAARVMGGVQSAMDLLEGRQVE